MNTRKENYMAQNYEILPYNSHIEKKTPERPLPNFF